MKRNILLLISLFTVSQIHSQDLLISGIMDGPLSGGTPKVIELFAKADIPDLTLYKLGVAANGSSSSSASIDISGGLLANEHYYVTATATEFSAWFGFGTDAIDGSTSFNGDDVIELYYDPSGNFTGSEVIYDRFGVIGVDGTGEDWEYLDGWAYRTVAEYVDEVSNPNLFDISQWSFSGPNALDNETSNATAAIPFPTQALPVKLRKFEVKPLGKSAQIVWTTSSELNNDYFEIQHSLDGVRFSTKQMVEGAGTSTSILDYSTEIENLQAGTHYFRLRQVDLDGRSETFQIRSVQITQSEILVYPSLADYSIQVDMEQKQADYVIFNHIGARSLQGTVSKNGSIDISNLSPGNYFIRIENQTIQFVKL